VRAIYARNARGRLAQDGTHAELMVAEGLYARMFRAQVAWYVREEE
jgi:ABC-type transport system involved in cytochrome bd biosynthesis fused ATPase/permease subunit